MAKRNRETLVGVFEDRRSAEQAVNELHRAGFDDDQIGFARRDDEGQSDRTSQEGSLPGRGTGSQAGEGLAGGAIVGGILGAAAALLIPGVGPAIAGGILAPILGAGATAAGVGAAGAAAGAAVGSLTGGLMGLGIPEGEAEYYQGEFEAGRVIVTVRPGSRWSEAESILQRYGAYDASSQSSRATHTASTTSRTQGHTETSERDRMQLREERLDVDKREVETGEVRLRKDVVEEQKNIDVPVTRDEVYVERHPVSGDRPASGRIGEGETLAVPVHEEVVDVNKETVVREEVEVGKREVEGTQRVSDTVRREEAHLETEGDVEVKQGEKPTDDRRRQDPKRRR
jgi:uncharacterized protein (TIGR02271 family)